MLYSLLLDITPPDFDSSACTTEVEFWVCPATLLERTRRDFVNYKYLLRRPHLRSWHIRRSCRSCSKLQAIPTAYGRLAWHFSDHQGTLIESLGPVPRDTVVNPFWDKLVGSVAPDWITASLASSSGATTSCFLVSGHACYQSCLEH